MHGNKHFFLFETKFCCSSFFPACKKNYISQWKNPTSFMLKGIEIADSIINWCLNLKRYFFHYTLSKYERSKLEKSLIFTNHVSAWFSPRYSSMFIIYSPFCNWQSWNNSRPKHRFMFPVRVSFQCTKVRQFLLDLNTNSRKFFGGFACLWPTHVRYL